MTIEIQEKVLEIEYYLLVKFEANAEYISVEISFCKGMPEYFLIITSYSEVNN